MTMGLARSLWRLRMLAIAILAVLLASAEALADGRADTQQVKRLLYVGNSFFYYNNSLHGHVNRMIAAAIPKEARRDYQSYSVTISGGHLKWHDVSAYLDAGIGSSSFDENNEIVATASPLKFDTVLMMDCSRCPYDEVSRAVFHEQVRLKGEAVRSKGARPMLFMTWAYSDKPEMTAVLARQYQQAGRDNGMEVVPAGLAFERALSGRPGLALHVADRRHPSLAGTYLAACTVLASVYGIDPRGNRYGAGLSDEDAAYLQTVAWETVQGFRNDSRRE